MKAYRNVWALIVAVGLLATACAEVTGPTAPAAELEPSLSIQGNADGQYIVELRGNGANALAARVTALGGKLTFLHEGVGLAFVEGMSASAATQLGRFNGVAAVHPDVSLRLAPPRDPISRPMSLDGATSQANPAGAILAGWQWNLQQVGAPQAWASGRLGSPSVTVAIVDTGLDYDSFDLDGLVDLTRSHSFVPTDDQIVETFFPERHPITDLNSHGTNVGQQVSSTALVFAGVSSMTTLTGVKVLDHAGRGFLSRTLMGILYAVDTDADIINLSLGGAFPKQGQGRTVSVINRVFNYAHQRGVVMVVAAGNDGANLDRDGHIFDTYCDAPHVICVSATGPVVAGGAADLPAFYTNFGRSAISVGAPGGNSAFQFSVWPWGVDFASWVWSLCSRFTVDFVGDDPEFPFLGGLFVCGSVGTSQAAPHVSGLAALLIAEHGKRRPAQIRSIIEQTADRTGSPGRDPFVGRGRINVPRALGL